MREKYGESGIIAPYRISQSCEHDWFNGNTHACKHVDNASPLHSGIVNSFAIFLHLTL